MTRYDAVIRPAFEDDYLVTEHGLEWITKVPRDIGEIEALIRQHVVPPVP